MGVLALLPLLAACGPPPAAGDRVLHDRAVALVSQDPAAAGVLCADLVDPTLAADCRWAAAAALAPTDPRAAGALCGALDGVSADECWFLVAEQSQDPARCARAGRFRFDCQMHLMTLGLRALSPALGPADLETQAAAIILSVGLDPSTPQLWSSVFRSALVHQRPLDRASCLAVSDAGRRAACLDTAISELEDRLNRARDMGGALCEGPLPASAAYTPDETLDAVLARRRAGDLCDPAAVRPPPLGAGR